MSLSKNSNIKRAERRQPLSKSRAKRSSNRLKKEKPKRKKENQERMCVVGNQTEVN